MKTFSKFLSLLMVVVMCLSLFGASAYAGGLGALSEGGDLGQSGAGLGSFGDQASAPEAGSGLGSFGDSYQEPEADFGLSSIPESAPASSGSGLGSLSEGESITLVEEEETEELGLGYSESTTFNSAAGVIATVGTTGCKTLEEINQALANGGTLTLVANVSGTIVINRASTIDLNGKKLTGTIQVYAPLTIRDSVGTGECVTNPPVNVLTGGSVSISGGKYPIDSVTLYIASGYMLDGSGKVVPKPVASGTAIALVNGSDCYNMADLATMLTGNAAVVLNQDVAGDVIFHAGGSLDLNGYTLTGNVSTSGSLSISDRIGTGKITGTVSNIGSGTIAIVGGGFDNEPNSNYIASGYKYDTASKRVVAYAETSQARIGNTYYASFADAVAAARDGDTIVALERTDSAANYTVPTDAFKDKKNLTVQLGSNGIDAVTLNNSSVNFVGGYIGTLNATNNSRAGINGTRVGSITQDATSSVGGSGSSSGGGTTPGGSGYNPGSYSVGNNPYYLYSGNTTYFYPLYSGTFNGFAISTDYAGNSYSVLREFFDYTLSGDRLTLKDSLLDGLTAGTYYMWGLTYNAAGAISGAQRMASFTVMNEDVGGGSGTWWLTPNHSVWYSSNDPLVFQSNLMAASQANKNPSTGINAIIRLGTNSSMVPSKSITTEQYWDLDNGEHNGYFMLGRNLLSSLSAEETYYMQIIDANHPNVNYTPVVSFRVGPTLRAVDTDKHVINSTRSLRFRASDTILRVYVGNIELTDEADYGISWDGKTVTLSYEFLNKRTPGNTYSIRVTTPSGDASTTFQILTTAQGSASPRTGDESNLGLWAAFLLLSGTAVVVLVPKLRKHDI